MDPLTKIGLLLLGAYFAGFILGGIIGFMLGRKVRWER